MEATIQHLQERAELATSTGALREVLADTYFALRQNKISWPEAKALSDFVMSRFNRELRLARKG